MLLFTIFQCLLTLCDIPIMEHFYGLILFLLNFIISICGMYLLLLIVYQH